MSWGARSAPRPFVRGREPRDPEAQAIALELRERAGSWEAASEASGLTRGALQAWAQGRRRATPRSRSALLASAQGDPPELREERIRAYAELVEVRGGWSGGGFIWEDAPARPVAELP